MADIIDSKDRFRVVKSEDSAGEKLFEFQFYLTKNGLFGTHDEMFRKLTLEESAILICELREQVVKIEEYYKSIGTMREGDEAEKFNPFLHDKDTDKDGE